MDFPVIEPGKGGERRVTNGLTNGKAYVSYLDQSLHAAYGNPRQYHCDHPHHYIYNTTRRMRKPSAESYISEKKRFLRHQYLMQ
jgi:hypothetical protein